MPLASDCRVPSRFQAPSLQKLLRSNQDAINGSQDAAIGAVVTEMPWQYLACSDGNQDGTSTASGRLLL